jgi:hypothetical protein
MLYSGFSFMSFSSVSIAFFVTYFVSKKDPVECTWLTCGKTVDETGTQDTRLIVVKPSFT